MPKRQPKPMIHPVRWDAEDWRRIHEAAAQMSAEQHLNLGPVDVIRSAVRRFLDERLGAAGSKQ